MIRRYTADSLPASYDAWKRNPPQTYFAGRCDHCRAEYESDCPQVDEGGMRDYELRAHEAERLVEAVADTLGLDLRTFERIGQAQPEYFREAHEKILEALADWGDDQKVPVCLNCGSPKVDWIDATASWRCQDCGAIEDSIGEGGHEFCSSITNTKGGVNP